MSISFPVQQNLPHVVTPKMNMFMSNVHYAYDFLFFRKVKHAHASVTRLKRFSSGTVVTTDSETSRLIPSINICQSQHFNGQDG